MPGRKVKFWNSLVTRFALFFAGLNVLVILIVGYLVYRQAESVITSHSQDRMRYSAQLAIQSFTSLLNEVANDIAVTTENSLLEDYIADPSETHIEDLNKLFSTLLRNKPNYFQIRLLDVNSNGKELIRFDKQQNEIIQIPDENLQFKGDRLYFREALKIPNGTYYYSAINLNEEFGKISLPHTPTLRAVGQVYNHNQVLQALLVINVDLSAFYNELSQIMESDNQLFLVNDAGDYLFAPDIEKCFGSQLKSGNSFYTDFRTSDSLFANPKLGSIQDSQQNQFQYYWEAINYSPGQRFYLVNMQEDNLLFRSAYLVRNYSIKLVVVVSLVSLLLAFLFVSLFSKRIKLITEAVVAYEKDREHPSQTLLPATRKDELGILARAFVRMRKRIDRQLKDLTSALQREQAAIKERDLFLENMSHELRTPLNAILGLSRLLSKNNPTPAQQPIVESLERSAVSLSGLMHDVLDHRKLKEGKIYLNLEPANFHSLLSDIHAVYRYDAINKSLAFQLKVEESLKNKSYLTDPLRFTQTITNLVVNAIKFTDKGSIAIKATTSSGPNLLKVEIVDTGKGIKPENLKKIQQRFYRENDLKNSTSEGYGLGLSIVKQLIELFNGSIEVSSKVETGSNFTVYLPLIESQSAAPAKNLQDPGELLPELKNSYRILHIEDDPSTLLMVAHALALPGISIDQLSEINETELTVKGATVDLIVSDLMLGNRSVDSLLRNHIQISNTLLILLSAFEPSRMKAITPYYLQKPFDINTLRNLVVMILGNREYDRPQLELIYEQYDNQTEKIRNFLNILQREFIEYINRFDNVFHTRDENEWKAIMHKLTTHIKSLNLKQLSKVIPDDPDQLNHMTIDAIKNNLLYALLVFRYESHNLTKS